ncbi:MAG: 30S ribosomal protein S4 [Candidatus Yonathbacteria bacterium CG_4_10_14_3_um_filter_47_65]|uniref:Small ribosomal subunit protein uS4 n=2 Tax=Parcubacteria group TaxID=1794811 RepID=A0A2M8D5D2_9BACT|nr:MAG: 30S ribosomal protein S4 [Candidatus Nomurabacteria bacterium CG1_02_47_685]PIP03810.1 MAG: 30S ribosomal protein S4 [Candidatus Yonathbacteria bacterium CG23_combo_of_CG06-09_8_20_14_all_46_18]PIQ32528.1 MAG: 30S ribosomal protein S4 [Candidatus Yonathbacteria bacterium CG17_big_fil_post_rev_8_21_14_2_50_46_19]PIX56424.1 MAG: 30S ribosomal protein S4 [Candidatus Yonathbacteria bacterium CG_4_10_14_3_um_filter_47_65]PIY57969.1 MAG: 30S ribosomal protein S4 [Candidatus Yonathbacteria bac
MVVDKKCKKCRRAGEKLFLKGERCFTPKCAFERKPYPPGKTGTKKRSKRSATGYGLQLREKQKVKNIYRVDERQFATYVKEAAASHDTKPAEKLYQNLELRLDNVVFRMGFAFSRSIARQMVTHGHVTVNGRRVTIPSYRLKEGDQLGIRPGSEDNGLFNEVASNITKQPSIPWLAVDVKKLQGSVSDYPKVDKEKSSEMFDLTSVIEFYSR